MSRTLGEMGGALTSLWGEVIAIYVQDLGRWAGLVTKNRVEDGGRCPGSRER
jgi:hypothetical protein